MLDVFGPELAFGMAVGQLAGYLGHRPKKKEQNQPTDQQRLIQIKKHAQGLSSLMSINGSEKDNPAMSMIEEVRYVLPSPPDNYVPPLQLERCDNSEQARCSLASRMVFICTTSMIKISAKKSKLPNAMPSYSFTFADGLLKSLIDHFCEPDSQGLKLNMAVDGSKIMLDGKPMRFKLNCQTEEGFEDILDDVVLKSAFNFSGILYELIYRASENSEYMLKLWKSYDTFYSYAYKKLDQEPNLYQFHRDEVESHVKQCAEYRWMIQSWSKQRPLGQGNLSQRIQIPEWLESAVAFQMPHEASVLLLAIGGFLEEVNNENLFDWINLVIAQNKVLIYQKEVISLLDNLIKSQNEAVNMKKKLTLIENRDATAY